MKKTVSIIFGGEGCEREISILSAKALYELIDKTKYNLIPIFISGDGIWRVLDSGDMNRGAPFDSENFTYPVKLGKKSGFITNGGLIKVDLALPCLHGDIGEDGIIQGALQAAHIPYLGQDVYCCAATQDKAYTKLIAKDLGIPTARWISFVSENATDAKARADRELGYPMFLKPSRLGSSIGATKVLSEQDFQDAYGKAFRAGGGFVLAEELIDIEYELECAFIDTGEARFFAGGVITQAEGFYDYNSKYSEKSSARSTVSSVPGEIKSLAEEYSKALRDALNLKYLSRIDYFVTASGKLFFNEINTFPGMTEKSLYPKLTEKMGYKSGEFINELISSAL